MKRAAARAALDELPREGVIGLGSGATMFMFLEALADAVREGRQLVGVASSEATRTRARALGIPLLGDEGPWPIAVTVDGADEVDRALDLIKGGGGAQTREKIVSSSSAKNVIVVDETKLSHRLGEQRPIPIEVLEFGHLATKGHLARHGEPVLRETGGVAIRTDLRASVVLHSTTNPVDHLRVWVIDKEANRNALDPRCPAAPVRRRQVPWVFLHLHSAKCVLEILREFVLDHDHVAA
jgi:ribose 5-phosphate isomerase A